MDLATLKAQQPQSAQGNFYVKDTIGVPHPYMIGAKHVAYAADHHFGMLGEAAIIGAEAKGIYCEMCRGKLTYQQHEQAIVIGCRAPIKEGNKANDELHQYLLALKPLVEGKWAGFAFVDEQGK